MLALLDDDDTTKEPNLRQIFPSGVELRQLFHRVRGAFRLGRGGPFVAYAMLRGHAVDLFPNFHRCPEQLGGIATGVF